MSKVTVKWQASDGYVDKDRPQFTEIEVGDFTGLDVKAAKELFNEIMQEEFLQTVNWECDHYDGSVAEIMAAAKADEVAE